jgi:hypothetical protein
MCIFGDDRTFTCAYGTKSDDSDFLLGRSSGGFKMKRLSATMAILLLSGGFALAQGTGPSTTSVTNGQANPALTPASPGDIPVGRAPGVNPNNAEDMTGRSNSQDRSQPNASNPQQFSPSPPALVVK